MPLADFSLKGRVAVVTGASRGIGEAIARGLAENGAMQCAYSMTKAAVINMTKGFAKELGSSNVRVNAICPGVVETKFAAMLINTPEIYDQFIHQIPLGRHAQPSEMVGLAVYLASDASSYTTGAAFVSDGGMTA